jgi:hypothetical protein
VLLATSSNTTLGADSLGNYHCQLERDVEEQTTTQHKKVVLDVHNGSVVSFFSSSSLASSDSDLRPGYAITCERDLKRFRQAKGKGKAELLLRYRPNEYDQDHRDCAIRLIEARDEVRVRSDKCTYECLNLDLTLPKDGKVCRATN